MDRFCQQKLSFIFQNTRFFLGWWRPGFFWTLLKGLFEFEPPGAQREDLFTFPRYIVILELGGAPLIFQFCLFVIGVVHLVSRLSKQSLRCCVDSGDALWTSNLTKHMSNFSDRFFGCLNEMYCAPASIAFSPLFFWSGCLDVFELMWGLQPAPAYNLYFFWSGTPVAAYARARLYFIAKL